MTRFVDEHPAGRNIVLLHGGKDCTKEFLEVHSEAFRTSEAAAMLCARLSASMFVASTGACPEDYILAFAPNSFVGCLEGSSVPPPRRPAHAAPVTG